MTGIETIAAITAAAASAAGAGVAISQAVEGPPKPPKIPEAPKPPDIRSVDRIGLLRAAAKGSQANQTILGGTVGSDANVSRPKLLGGQ